MFGDTLNSKMEPILGTVKRVAYIVKLRQTQVITTKSLPSNQYAQTKQQIMLASLNHRNESRAQYEQPSAHTG